jgi:hypothetical protein
MTLHHLTRVALTLLLALAAAELCVWLNTPIPWMLGPLLATAVASVLGAPTRSEHMLRNAGQWVIGAALGLYFTPQVSALVVSLWWAIVLAVLWALALGGSDRHCELLVRIPGAIVSDSVAAVLTVARHVEGDRRHSPGVSCDL